jgi:lipopolysaccharide export system permease protein
MDELIGKGLGAIDILQLLSLMSTTLVPMALPLGILLASIMTFGNLGEHFELIAIKSSGISLIRFMQPLFILLSILSVGAFVFNNNLRKRYDPINEDKEIEKLVQEINQKGYYRQYRAHK